MLWPQVLRRTSGRFFRPLDWLAGIDGATWTTAAVLVPAGLVGAAVGHAASRFLDQRTFRVLVLAILAITGPYMLWTTIA